MLRTDNALINKEMRCNSLSVWLLAVAVFLLLWEAMVLYLLLGEILVIGANILHGSTVANVAVQTKRCPLIRGISLKVKDI